jgi:cullin 1
MGSWPFNQTFEMMIPPKFEETLNHFKIFYNEKHTGRTLTWLYSQSKGEMAANYRIKPEKGKKGDNSLAPRQFLLVASTVQMTVLLFFNNKDKSTVKELSRAVGSDLALMQQVVSTLIRNNLLLRDGQSNSEPDDRLPEPDDIVKYNKDYTNKRTRVNINVTYKIEAKTDLENTHKNVEEDRRLLIQAAIVRIMKMRKTINHQGLVAETIQQLSSRFTPSVPAIKKNIETLIEKEYVERSTKNRDVLNYLA